MCALLLSLFSVARAATNDFFPLMAWNETPGDSNVLKQIHDCGLTVAGFVNAKSLDLCQAAGLKAIVSDPRTSGYDWKNVDENMARSNVTQLVKEVGNHPALYGFYLRDEPGADMFGGLAKVASLIRELAPGKWPYINLFPNYASEGQMGVKTYEEYLQKCVDTCHPTELSYDHYALMDDGSLRDGFWQNLQQMSAQSVKSKIPFWNIVLSCAHFNYREPTAADLRFEVFSSLAYGARGIAYFTYFAPQCGNYRCSPVDQFGNLTATWYALQNVNLQVGKWAPTLLKLNFENAYHFGDVPPLGHGPGEQSLVKSVGGAPFLVGEFTHQDGKKFILVVNKDVVKSHNCELHYRQTPKNIKLVSPYTGELTDFAGEQLWLAPGQGSLLQIEL